MLTIKKHQKMPAENKKYRKNENNKNGKWQKKDS